MAIEIFHFFTMSWRWIYGRGVNLMSVWNAGIRRDSCWIDGSRRAGGL